MLVRALRRLIWSFSRTGNYRDVAAVRFSGRFRGN
jgi:hypothetical protein